MRLAITPPPGLASRKNEKARGLVVIDNYETTGNFADQGEASRKGMEMLDRNVNLAPDGGEYVEVEVERVGADGFDRRPDTGPDPMAGLPKAPVAAAWLTLLAAWFFYAAQVPFTVFLAVPVNLAALALAVLCMTRGRPGHGILIVILGTVGSLCTYLISLITFLGS